MRTDRCLLAEREVPADVVAAALAEVLEAVDKVAAPGEHSRMRVRVSRRRIPEIRVALQKKTIPRKRIRSRKNQRRKNKRTVRTQVS